MKLNMGFVKILFLLFLQLEVAGANEIMTTDQEYMQRQEILYKSFKEYMQATKEYTMALDQASDSLKMWRRRKLAEIFEERLSSLEKNLILSNGNLIQEFNKFIKQNGTQALDDVLLIRLAQLYFEKANLVHNQQEDKLSPPNYKSAIMFSKLFVKNFPQSPIGDKAYYLIGFALEEMGRTQESIPYYQNLITLYPVSVYSEEVRWRLGEIYFSNGQYQLAQEMYKDLAKLKSSSFYTKSLYKLGATYFVLKMYSEASSTFQKLVQDIDKNSLSSPEDNAILDESLDYIATLMTNDKKLEVYKKILPEVYYRLGMLYKKRLDEKSMRQVFDYAANQFPSSKQIPNIYAELIDSYESTRETEKANIYRSQFIQLLTGDQNWWAENDKYKNIIFQTQDLLEFNLIKSAEYYADKGYRANDFTLLQTAKSRYYNFITKYPWSSFRDYAKLELADIEYYLGFYNSASTYYFEIVNGSTSATLREEAAYSLIWSEVKKVNYELNFAVKNNIPQDIKRSKLTDQENVFARSAVFYATKIPTSPRRNRVIYKLSEIYFEHGDFDLASQYLNMIISDTANSNALTVRAYRFLMEIYNLKGDWKSLESVQELYSTSQFFADIESLDKDSLRQKYRDKLEAAYNFELEGKWTDAIKEYSNVIVQNPRLPFIDFLNMKIVSLYVRTNQYSRALNLCDILAAGKYKTEVQYLRAQIKSRQLKFEQATQLFEEFYLKHKQHPWAEEALLNIISLRSQMKQTENLASFFKKIPVSNLTAYPFYSYVESLLDTKKNDEVYKAVVMGKKNNRYDGYRLNSYILRAQASKDDYLGVERNCSVIERAIESSKIKSAYSTLNQSFCEYIRLKVLIGQSAATLEDLVAKLNKIYNFKVDRITLLSLNEIVSRSDLRNNFKSQFEQLIEKGWSLARAVPLSEESKNLSTSVASFTGKIPLTLADFINWRITLSEIFDFVPVVYGEKWKEVKINCDYRQYQQCMDGFIAMKKENPLPEIYENAVIAALKLANEKELQSAMTSFLQESNYSELSQQYAYVLGYQQLIPSKNKVEKFSVSGPFAVVAQTHLLLSESGFKAAHDYMVSLLTEDSAIPLQYWSLAKMYFEKDYPDLSRTVLTSGFENTGSKALLAMTYQVNALTYATTVVSAPVGDQDLSPAEYFSLAFAALKNKDLGTVEASLSGVKKYKHWFDLIKNAQLQYLENTYMQRDIAQEKK